jgi:hypothetical protein
VSNNRHVPHRTLADVDGRSFAGQADRSPGGAHRDLASGRRGHRARCVPDRPDDQGIWRTLTDRPRSCRPAVMLVTALAALIPKLIVQDRHDAEPVVLPRTLFGLILASQQRSTPPAIAHR